MNTIGSLVAANPSLGPVLETLGIDFCCGGQRSLDVAATERGLDPRTLALVLSAVPALAPVSNGKPNPSQLPTPELIDYIIENHHAFVRSELPRLLTLAGKVARAHGQSQPGLIELEAGVAQLSSVLLDHLRDEETTLFPALRELGPELTASLAPFLKEHQEAGQLFARFRALTGNFDHPAWECTTYRTLMEALGAFESDLHQHIHLENNVLFLRAAS